MNPSQGFAQGNPIVHLEASGTDSIPTTANNPTFFGCDVGWPATDNRERLATTIAGTGGSSLLVWRDSKTVTTPFGCPSRFE